MTKGNSMYVCVRVCVLVACVCVRAEGGAPRCLADHCTRLDTLDPGSLMYSVHNKSITIKYKESEFIELTCAEGVTLESPGYPRFQTPTSVSVVTVSGCDVTSVSLHDTFAALNVIVDEELILEDVTGNLTAQQFHKLQHLTRLRIRGNYHHRPYLQSDALQTLGTLRTLTLHDLKLTPREVDKLPGRIKELILFEIGITEYNLNSLSYLSDLEIIEYQASVAVKAQNATSLRKMFVNSGELLFPPEWRPPSLRRLEKINWQSAGKWSACPELEELWLRGAVTNQVRLPARWVALCPRLVNITIEEVILELDSKVFSGSVSLQRLEMTRCKLRLLPEDLFKDTLQLTYLNLESNKLQSLPSGLFKNLLKLEHLVLGQNELTSEVATVLSYVLSLKVLDLSLSPTITDFCSNDSSLLDPGESSLKSLVNLRELDLKYTAVSRVCSDWRTSMLNLARLDLTYTYISSLTYLDFQYERSTSLILNGFEVIFAGIYIRRIDIDRENHESVVESLSTNKIELHLQALLPCDCHDYWTAVTFRKVSRKLELVQLMCDENHRSLSQALKNNELKCEDPKLCEGEKNCTCIYEPDEQLGAVVTVNCEHGALSEMPALKYNSTPHWRLLLANNHIRTVQAQALPPQLHELDLRNNSVERLGAGAGTRVSGALLWLSGNEELDCTCGGHELLGRAVVQDSAQARCTDGRSLDSVPDPGACGNWLGVALAVLGVAAAAVAGAAAYCARPQTRLRVKVLLLRAGWLRRPPESDDGRRYDAFVSYAHEDGAVVEELVRRLESELGYRLCLHYRDWGPGEWIHVQIAASVEASRRTLVVVSRHFLRSKWARQEFREAHAAALTDLTPRLLLLFLDPPHDLPLDAELRSYIRRNTYLLWDDPWFWSKLFVSMPPAPPKPKSLIPEQLALMPELTAEQTE